MRRYARLLAVLLAGFVMASCGGGDAEAESQDPEVRDQVTVDDPDQLAEEIAENYTACMGELEEILADRPDPETLKPMLEDLTDRYIGIFVELGHQVATYDSTTVDEIGRGVMSSLYGIDIQWMTDASSHYHSIDPEVSSMISELNIITQYAFFDLLRDQRPSEAERLGLTDRR